MRSLMYVNRELIFGAVKFGGDLEKICSYIGIDKSMLNRPEEYLEFDNAIKLFDAITMTTGLARPGLKIGSVTNLNAVGLIGEIMIYSDTLSEVWKTLCNYPALLGEITTLKYHEDKEYAYFSYFPHPMWELMNRSTALHAGDFTFAAVLKNARQLSGMMIAPVKLHISHNQTEHLKYYKEAFEAPIIFNSPEACIVFRKSDMNLPVQSFNKQLYLYFKDLATSVNQKEMRDGSFAYDVKLKIQEQFWPQIPTGEDIAARLFMTYKTFQRRLAAENISYRDLTSTIRMEYAQTMLRSGRFKISEISGLLNYSEPSAFARAYKNFYGKTITQTFSTIEE